MFHHSAPSLCVARLGVSLLLSAAAASAQFAPAVNLPVGPQPDSVAAGDWDGDGDQDLAVPVDSPDRVVFFFNDGAGGFADGVEVLTGSGTGPHTAVAADLDGDGDDDVAVSLHNSNEVQVLLNDGTGDFSLGSATAVGFEPRALEVGDLDGGAPDLVVVNEDSNSVSVLLNNGDATFNASTVPTGIEPRDVALADLNGDGDLDLAIAVHDMRQIELQANDGSGAFSEAGTLSMGSELRPEGIVAGDLDGDQDLDLVAAASGNGENVVSVFENTGTGTGAGSFAGPVNSPVGGFDPSGVVLLDVDLDGDTDVATSNSDSSDVSLLLNDGDGNLTGGLTFPVQAEPDFLLAADLDGNGGTDLVTANEGSGSISLLLNQNSDEAFTDLGGGIAGVTGIPQLSAEGTLQPGTLVTVTLTNAAPNTLAVLVVGLDADNLPFKGGTLVPDDDLLVAVATDAQGEVVLSGTWPDGFPPASDLFLQAAVLDPAAVKGIALSNALQGITP